MATSIYNKFYTLVEDMAEAKHNFQSDTLKVALSNASNAPSASLDKKLTDITTIDTTNLDSTILSVTSSGQTNGVYKLVLADKLLTATADVPAFRYAIIYNDTHTDKPLIAWFDYASEVSLHENDTFKLDFGDQLFSLS